MPKIIFEREKCIGCGSCAALCPKYWEMAEDGKSNLKGSKNNEKTSNEELEIEELGCNQDAVDSCPVQIIHINK
ncbi:MAG TPA: ferredoxin [Candidatus Parcubacteria bacterium]|jgi:ferredoxin|nr:ferredoxin [Parcubacteria group bacterium]HJN62106.1 ferredoxin [Candidatus Parcubacteria bacterium]|tara:strand:- start:151 stop:372 length:222 start_codon:yes stop_codon:yes gene_type:complete